MPEVILVDAGPVVTLRVINAPPIMDLVVFTDGGAFNRLSLNGSNPNPAVALSEGTFLSEDLSRVVDNGAELFVRVFSGGEGAPFTFNGEFFRAPSRARLVRFEGANLAPPPPLPAPRSF